MKTPLGHLEAAAHRGVHEAPRRPLILRFDGAMPSESDRSHSPRLVFTRRHSSLLVVICLKLVVTLLVVIRLKLVVALLGSLADIHIDRSHHTLRQQLVDLLASLTLEAMMPPILIARHLLPLGLLVARVLLPVPDTAYLLMVLCDAADFEPLGEDPSFLRAFFVELYILSAATIRADISAVNHLKMKGSLAV
eukprot:CAMPEP_0179088598 /NCGR_PEP_ID=MMETSP0796-20121207/40321_1 /TAXON_ID=73915 /ORGANISM="Pyrodinium bahamense, Strain pbaha01" /LENGTH=192 /DNA_ID=CAMNT_0020786131 /DNA_START=498 /DNA_END=1073 /DNA_ORIENTATION=-